MQIKLGAFGKLKNYPDMDRAEYDYAELDSVEIAQLSEERFEKAKEMLSDGGLKTLVFARALPYDEPIFHGNDFLWDKFQKFVEKSCRRMQMLHAEKWILGNGKARSMPEYNRKYAEEQFLKLMRILCETAQKYGITVLLEPLGPRYSNYINTIEEAVDICKILKADNLFTMCDLRHMVDSHDNFSNIIKYGKYIRHVHIDNPLLYPQRIYPEQEDGYDYSEYFRALQKIDYDGTLTVEADIPQNYLDSCLSMKSFLSAYGVLTESDR